VQQAPGIPCSLSFEGKEFQQSSGAVRRENADAYSVVIVREGGRSSIPETSMIEPVSRGVLDTSPSRGMTTLCPSLPATNAKRLRKGAQATKQSSLPLFGAVLDCFAEPVIGRRFAPTRWLCAEHDRQLGGESPLSSLMVAKD
jgi:hypothetical protein